MKYLSGFQIDGIIPPPKFLKQIAISNFLAPQYILTNREKSQPIRFDH